MKRLIAILLLGGAATWCAVALATPSQGQSSTILAVGAMQADLAFNTGLTTQASGTTWGDKQYSADQLPEFRSRLRAAGVTNLGLWMNLHPLISAKFGMVPIGRAAPARHRQPASDLPARRRVRRQSHPGYLTSTVVSGTVIRYGVDCSSQTFTAGQSFYETGANTFIVKNPSTTDPAVVNVTFVVPGRTPTTALRLDKTQPVGCTQ